MIINLKIPVPFKDTVLHSIELDLSSLTGYDLLSAEDELRMAGVQVPAWDFSRNFLATVAAKCAHIPVDVIKSMNIADFTRIINEVMSFLAGAASSSSTPTNSDN